MSDAAVSRKAAARAARAWLRSTWPQSIGAYLPLAIGVHEDVHAAAAGLHSPRAVQDALHAHTACPRYRSALSRPGAMRVALDGTQIAPVTPHVISRSGIEL